MNPRLGRSRGFRAAWKRISLAGHIPVHVLWLGVALEDLRIHLFQAFEEGMEIDRNGVFQRKLMEHLNGFVRQRAEADQGRGFG